MSSRVIIGDCRAVLPTLEAGSVQTCVTSPPYWGLRDYGVAGQLGLESTPQEYVERMVAVFREVHRVLRDDGTLWLNLGDSYASNPSKGGSGPNGKNGYGENYARGRRGSGRADGIVTEDSPRNRDGSPPCELPAKNLVGIPWRVAFALQADGWYLRQDIIWAKPNPMPESVQDRCTKSHEYMFLLAKSERYYFDYDALQEPCDSGPSDIRKMLESQERIGGKHKDLVDPYSKASSTTNIGQKRAVGGRSGNKERKPASARGVPVDTNGSTSGAVAGSIPWEGLTRNKRSVWTVGTAPYSGAHFATFPPALIEPCILAGSKPGDTVLDPFGGSGTTGQVSEALGRKWLLIELNGEYGKLCADRTRQIGMELVCGS